MVKVEFKRDAVIIQGTTNLAKAKLAVHTASAYEFDSSYDLLSMKENSVVDHANNTITWYC